MAVTVKVDELPWAIVAGVAVIVTVGLTARGDLEEAAVPLPQEVTVNKAINAAQRNKADHE